MWGNTNVLSTQHHSKLSDDFVCAFFLIVLCVFFDFLSNFLFLFRLTVFFQIFEFVLVLFCACVY